MFQERRYGMKSVIRNAEKRNITEDRSSAQPRRRLGEGRVGGSGSPFFPSFRDPKRGETEHHGRPSFSPFRPMGREGDKERGRHTFPSHPLTPSPHRGTGGREGGRFRFSVFSKLPRLGAAILVFIVLLLPGWVSAQVRVKDIARIQGLQDTPLIGYGLVIGLDGTGDRKGSVFTVQSVGNMLNRFGITVPQNKIRLKNVAAVMVTGEILPLVRKGGRIDVVVSSLGDARSLEGGTLLLTPLLGKDGTVYAYAQGSVSIGGFNIEAQGGERIRRNYTLVGRVPNGAILEEEPPLSFGADGELAILLRRPDFTSAVRLAEAVNGAFGGQSPSVERRIAFARDAGTVLIEVPSDWKATDRLAKFIASVEVLEIEPDGVARVVINERTGTIVVGEHVRLSTAAVSHENLTIQIQATPVISQPLPFSRGETVVVPETEVTVTENEGAKMSVIPPTANIGDLAKALNALGVTPRDIIAIFQALKEAGALQGELVIM